MRLPIIIAFILSFISIAYADIDLSSDEYLQTMLKRVKEGKAGTYIKWQPLVLTYKDYKGSPDIDSPEFNQIVKKKFENGACSTYYTKYEKTPYNEVKRLADIEKDAEAMFEMFLRLDNSLERENIPIKHKYLLSAAENGNLNAYIKYIKIKIPKEVVNSPEWNKYMKILDTFRSITPSATFEKLEVILFTQKIEKREEMIKLMSELSNAGNYEHALFRASLGRNLGVTSYTDNITLMDYACEAYFRGCDFFPKDELKCGKP